MYNTFIINSICVLFQLNLTYTRQHVASNICGYFDLVSNMLPEIEQLSISGNMLLTRSK